MGIRRWKLPEQDINLPDLTENTGRPELVCAVLAARGYTTADEMNRFLATEDDLASPCQMKDMEKAVSRIVQGIENAEKIAVYGDYDCDGITSTVLLVSYLQSVGADVIYYIPDRETEGYGLNMQSVKVLADMGIQLIITVDNGISAHSEIACAASLGIDVVITDHHTPRETLPDAAAVVNPHRVDCPSDFKELAGVGVVFKLICALEDADSSELLEYYSDLVAIGTIADVVSLTGENRIIVRHGLAHLTESGRPGIHALMEIAGISADSALIGSEAVAYGLAPRINAAGRMGCVDNAVEMLLTDDVPYARELAEHLNEQNILRKKIEDDMLREIESILAGNPQLLYQRVLIISGSNWHHGVVGIAAARMVERYGKPCILFSTDGELARGSGRSIEGFSLIKAISACKENLIQYGGHTLAAGMTLKMSDLADFDRRMQRYCAATYKAMPVPLLDIDCILPPSKLTIKDIASLAVLEPFGAANTAPIFLISALTIDGLYPTTGNKHLRIRLKSGQLSFYAVYFGMKGDEFPYTTGDSVDVVAALGISEWNNAQQISIQIKDVRLVGMRQEDLIEANSRYQSHMRGEYGDMCQREDALPTRDEISVVYRLLRRYKGGAANAEALYVRLMNQGMDYCRLLVSIDVMEEMGLLIRTGSKVSLIENPPKVDLKNSAILKRLETV